MSLLTSSCYRASDIGVTSVQVQEGQFKPRCHLHPLHSLHLDYNLTCAAFHSKANASPVSLITELVMKELRVGKMEDRRAEKLTEGLEHAGGSLRDEQGAVGPHCDLNLTQFAAKRSSFRKKPRQIVLTVVV